MNDGLRQGLAALNLSLSEAQIARLLAYVDLMHRWGRVYNITAVRDPGDMLTHHVLDSLAVIRPMLAQRKLAALNTRPMPETGDTAPDPAQSEAMCWPETPPAAWGGQGEGAGMPRTLRLLDVGSGAGLPGVVVAICCPWLAVDCVDTVGKKAAFIQQVAATLKLGNLRGLHARVETLTDTYDVVTSRAFASLADFTAWSGRALADDGVWMAMKGKTPDEEMQALPAHIQVFHVEPLVVPGLQAQRCLVWMRPTA